MQYVVKLSVDELAALAALIGQPIDQVAANGWSAELRSGALLQPVIPVEVPTPDAEHPYGVVSRPLLMRDGQSQLADSGSVLAEDLGVVRAINVISTLVVFTPIVDCPAEEILPGVMLPPSRGYGLKYFSPGQREQAERAIRVGTLVDLDIAFELVCERRTSVVTYTRGYFIQVSLLGLPESEDWVSTGAYCRREVRGHLKAEPSNAADSR